MTNILQAVRVIVNSKIPDVASFYRSQNRINAVGDALEAKENKIAIAILVYAALGNLQALP
jgi:hypothetical protein